MKGQWDSASVSAFPNILREGDEMWIYYGGSDANHGDPAWQTRFHSGIFRARMRVDGFASADASYRGGELITKAVAVEGNRLELNADTSAGGVIRVEILDEDNEPIPGFTLDEADELNGNELQMQAQWKGAAGIGRLAGKRVHLRFVMRDCKLYAFQFTK